MKTGCEKGGQENPIGSEDCKIGEKTGVSRKDGSF